MPMSTRIMVTMDDGQSRTLIATKQSAEYLADFMSDGTIDAVVILELLAEGGRRYFFPWRHVRCVETEVVAE